MKNIMLTLTLLCSSTLLVTAPLIEPVKEPLLNWDNHLELERAPDLFKASKFIRNNVEAMQNADSKTIELIKNRFDEMLARKLQENPQALYERGTHGFTPAHQLVLKEFTLMNRLTTEFWPGQKNAYKILFDYALSQLDTGEPVQAMGPNRGGWGALAIRSTGIDKKPMTAREFKDALP